MKAADRNLMHDDNTEENLKAGVKQSFPDYSAKGIGTWRDGYPESQHTLGKESPPVPDGTKAQPIFRGDD
jgi:hypothetical protein